MALTRSDETIRDEIGSSTWALEAPRLKAYVEGLAGF